ncbi:hypothetical protein OQH60_07795 [Campylobacter sp. MIT 21-1685]|uniref:hypothetical protein n=1 Tax=unclassified Campylobacter TaxID=2593542 RepID=UPI00224B90F5|nr:MULTISPECIES: hypothetical protein [unclassified Campylobacter]MCX2683751.1 hypothetical protein [Campylobacter sp. MIT 21-1684]MCX2752035.1 hypothetical protein [Campylobacter sp. MIT 21-1682]MCX2808239.1 hypothetical protein [Campylobacter sp. MIT 21-1685]
MRNSLQTQLFSQNRLRDYTDTKEHEDNLCLIAHIAHKIGILEIIIRNKIDSLLLRQDSQWLEKIVLQEQSRDKIISTQNLGFWLKVVDFYKIHNVIFDTDFLDTLDFKKYFIKNPHYFYSTNLMRHHKAKAILQLLRLIRNRAFHFENLYKIVGNGYPRLNIKITNKYDEAVYIAIHPNKIIEFLDDLLISFHKDLVHYGES